MTHHIPLAFRIVCHPATDGYAAAHWQKDVEGVRFVGNDEALIEKLFTLGYILPYLPPQHDVGNAHSITRSRRLIFQWPE